MGTIVILSQEGIVKIKISEKSWKEIEKKYDEDIEVWMVEKGIDEEAGVNLGCANWQFFEDEPEISEYEF